MPKIDWTSADWALSDRKIAAHLGVSAVTVMRHRKKMQAPAAPPRNIDWSDVDWRRTDRDIAEEKGCSRNAVTMHRLRHGIAPAPRPDWENIDWHKPTSEIAAETGRSVERVGGMRTALKKRAGSPLEKGDARLTRRQIFLPRGLTRELDKAVLEIGTNFNDFVLIALMAELHRHRTSKG